MELGIKKFPFHNFEFDDSWYEFESVEEVSIMEDPIKVEKYRDITRLLESTP